MVIISASQAMSVNGGGESLDGTASLRTLDSRHSNVTAKLLSSPCRSIVHEGESHGAPSLWRH